MEGVLPPKWRMATVEEISRNRPGAIAIGPFGSRMKADRYVTAGIPVIRGQNLSGARALQGPFVYVSDETAQELPSCLAFPGDIVLPHRGAIGEVGIVPAGQEPRYMLSTSLMKVSCDANIADPTYVYYFFRSPQGRREILKYASTVGTPGIGQPLASLKAMRLALPPLDEQRAIGHVLGVLDDKIKTNGQISDACRHLSSAVLRVRLAAAASTGALTARPLGDVATINMRTAKQGTGSLRYLDISSVGDGLAEDPVPMSWAVAPGRARRGAAHGDVLWSTVRPNRRSHCLLLEPPEDLVVSTGFAVLTPKGVGSSFLFGVTDTEDFVGRLVAVAEGSAYPAVRAERFADVPVPVLTEPMLSEYEESTMPLHERAHAANRESAALEALRDALLPPLLSGELPVRNAEFVVEEAV